MTPDETTAQSSQERVRCALDLLDRGCVLIPLLKDSKRPAAKGWQRTGSVAREQVEQFAARGNYGILTGPRSGLIVLDVDPRHGGKVPKDAPATWTGETPSGGLHLIYRAPDPCPGNSAGKLGPGLDIRGRGGYVVGPGSWWDGLKDGEVELPGGGGYRWVQGRSPKDLPLARFPLAWLKKLLPPARKPKAATAPAKVGGGDGSRERRYAMAALRRLADEVRTASEGTRNATLCKATWKAGAFIKAGSLSQAEIEDTMSAAGLDAGLTAAEVRATVQSALHPQREPEPRGVPERTHRQAVRAPLRVVPPPTDVDAPPEVNGKREAPSFQAVPTDTAGLYPEVLPPIEWEWPGLVASQEIGVLSADGGVGKTWLLYAAALAAAGSLPMWEEFNLRGPRRVLLLDEEKSARFSMRRITLLCRGMGISRELYQDAIAPNLTIYNRAGWRLDMQERGFYSARDALWRVLEKARPNWILADSLSCLHSRDENDNASMHRFMQEFIKPMTGSGATVIITHHHRKPGKESKAGDGAEMRGATSVRNAVDSHMTLTKGAEKGSVVLRHSKASIAQERRSMALAREDVFPDDESTWTYDAIGRPEPIGVRVYYSRDVAEDDPQQDGTCRAGVERVLRQAGADGLLLENLMEQLGSRWKKRTLREAADELVEAGLVRKAPDLSRGQGAARPVRYTWKSAWRGV